MTSISFDPIAHVYDALRGYPESVSQQIAEAMDKAMPGTKQTRLFEIGVGTGRFALPLVSLGRQYTGIDISEKMLKQLEEKLCVANWQDDMSHPEIWSQSLPLALHDYVSQTSHSTLYSSYRLPPDSCKEEEQK